MAGHADTIMEAAGLRETMDEIVDVWGLWVATGMRSDRSMREIAGVLDNAGLLDDRCKICGERTKECECDV